MFWEINFPPYICIFLGAGNSPTNLRLFVEEIFLRSRKAHRAYTKNTNVWKSHEMYINTLYMCEILLKLSILRNLLSSSYLYISWSRNFLTNLRLFVKENFLGSRRAHRDYTKKQKVWKSHKMYINTLHMCEILLKLSDFEKSTFLLISVYFLELEFLWQVSDCLSRKFFWDLAEPIVIIQKTQKSIKPRKCI